MGTRAHWVEHLQDRKGNVLDGATVYVYNQGTTTPISETMYQYDSDHASAANTLSNPLTADASGKVEFFLAAVKRCDIVVSYGGMSDYRRTVDVGTGGGGANALNDLTDVDTTGLADNNILVYDQATSQWKPEAPSGGGASALNDLTDVTITAAASGDFLRHNGTAWVDATIADGDIPASIARDAEVAAAYQALSDLAFARKTADESVTSSTTLQDDDHLLFAVGANQVWMVEFFLAYNGAAAGDLRVGLSVPTGTTWRRFTIGPDTTVADSAAVPALEMGSRTSGVASFGSSTSADDVTARVVFLVSTGGTAGNVVLQWAQLSSNATATTLKSQSFLSARKVA